MKYLINEQIRSFLKANGQEEGFKDVISFEDLKKVYDKVKLPKKSLLYYTSTTTPQYKSPVQKQEKSEEYIKLMKRLRAEQQENEYRSYLNKEENDMSIIDSIGGYRHQEVNKGNGSIAKEVNYQLTTIVNILITTGSVGYAVWYWSGSSIGGMNNGYRILLSLLAAIVVLIAEVVIFGGYLRRVDEARTLERAKVETVEIVETLVFQNKSSGIERYGSKE